MYFVALKGFSRLCFTFSILQLMRIWIQSCADNTSHARHARSIQNGKFGHHGTYRF
jgi:hypothetical protein